MRQGISMHGIAVDDALVLTDSPLRVLEPGEPPTPGKAFAGDVSPVSGKSTTAGPVSTAEDIVIVESGDWVFRLCRAAHVAALGSELWQQENANAAPFVFDNFGSKAVLVIPVDFPDLPGANTSASEARTVMEAVNQFYKANSFQQLSLDPVAVTPVLRLPRASTNYLLLGTAQLLADARGAADALGFHEFDYRFDVVTFRYIGFPWGGLGYIGGKGAFVQGPSFGRGAVEHELGHNLGNWHAGGWLTDDESLIGPGRRSEYGNEFDIMGSGPGHLNANFKFIADGVIVYVNGIEVFRRNLPLDPIAHTNNTGLEPSGLGYIRAELPSGLFGPVDNFVAVEMHQNRPDSATLLFDLALVSTDRLSPPGLSFAFDAEQGALFLRWDGVYWARGCLEAAEDPAGPWSEVTSGASGSYTQESVAFNGPQRFYRLRK